MSDIFNAVKDMTHPDKIVYVKSLSPVDKKKYDNYMVYQRVMKGRNKDRAKYNDYMKDVKKKSRNNNYEKYRLQNNRDVANNYAKKKLTPDAAADVINLHKLNNI